MAEERIRRLTTLFDEVLQGKKTAASKNPKLFLEAICKQTPAVTCIPRIVASSHGFETLLLALSSDNSLSFLNGQLTTFLEYVKEPALQTVCGGSVIRQVLAKLVDSPLMWKSLVKAAQDQILDQRALSAFSWLLIQLLSLPDEEAIIYLTEADDPSIHRALMSSSDDIGVQGQQIVRIAKKLAKNGGNYTLRGPGGRHDNDFPEIQKISVYPTQDELKLRTLDLYLPRACDVQERSQDPDGLAIHIDAQFRLLREDMLCDLREELTALTQPMEWRRKPLEIRSLFLTGVHCNERFSWSLQFKCMGDLPQFRMLNAKKRKKFLEENPKFLKNGLLVCLFFDKELVTLGTLVREEDLLIQFPSILCVQIPTTDVENVLIQLKNADTSIRLLPVDTAIFTYEPVLKQLQKTQQLSLTPEIVAWQPGTLIPPPEYDLSSSMQKLLQNLCEDYTCDLQSFLELKEPTKLDKAQAECFQAALQHRVVVIQGPPGTGKSFIGSLVGKAIHKCSNEKILVVCFTHHALDDFLEHLLHLGIPSDDIVRLGSAHKATLKTKPLALKTYKQRIEFSYQEETTITKRKQKAIEHANNLRNAFFKFNPRRCTRELLKFLESYEDDLPFHNAFQVPKDPDGMTWVGINGGKLDECYLVDRWVRGQDAGIFNSGIPPDYRAVWRLNHEIRKQKQSQWYQEMSKEDLAQVRKAGKLYNDAVEGVDAVFLEKDLAVIQEKRIIACTTTAAAKYSDILQHISPGVLLVEEAGEILESHVLTALGPETKHLILIGDHKQLRPKVNYELSVEKGTGYDLNRSLFERLILKGFPHQTLFSQHRMRPEISALVREITYPELKDAKDTQERPNLRGFIDNIIFVNHNEPETEFSGTYKLGEKQAMSSKQNLFEAKMTLKCVRYLGQQGYRADDIVVLTPYLGQLRLLHDELKVDNDPVLNDLDSHDLVRAGLMPAAIAEVSKPRLRISTIDNFQGEEANIVIASLTRSNIQNDIGFMSAPERLNVLISRARNALILIGNAEHFMGSPKGGDLWKRFIGLLKAGMHVYDGFPIHCERHTDRKATLQKPADFKTECPDGGCKEPCNKLLNCGIHKCPDRCHLLSDHSKIKCKAVISFKCCKGHVDRRECHDQDFCAMCKFKAKKALEEAVQEHLLQISEIDGEILLIKNETEGMETAKQGAISLEQQKDLQTTKNVARRKLVSNNAPNALTMYADATGLTPEASLMSVLALNCLWQYLLQSAKTDGEIQAIRTEAAKQLDITLEQKKLDLQAAKNLARRKVVSNDSPNALKMDTNATGLIPAPLLNSQSQHCEIEAIGTFAAKEQAVSLGQKKRDLQPAKNFARKTPASHETPYAPVVSTNAARWTRNGTPNSQWQHLLERAKIDHDIQAAHTEAAKQRVITLERTKRDLQIANRKSASKQTPNALTVGPNVAGPTSNSHWQNLLLKAKIDLEIETARSRAAKQRIIALECKERNWQQAEDVAERKSASYRRLNAVTRGANAAGRIQNQTPNRQRQHLPPNRAQIDHWSQAARNEAAKLGVIDLKQKKEIASLQRMLLGEN